MNIEKNLGKHVSKLLQQQPFKDWVVERSLEDDLEEPTIHYIFQDRGLELRCDPNEKISVIFLDSNEDLCEDLFEIPFSLNRAEVMDHFGKPSKSGDKVNDPVLSEYSAWDRFSRTGYTVHVEFRCNADQIKKITLMRSDVVPE